MKFIGIIPARYASTRFPGKPLAMIHGKTMIRRVWEQASKAGLDNLVVATDDDRIREHVASFGGKVVMTSPDHPSGTDRCREASNHMDPAPGDHDVLINIQGDEPYLYPEQIRELCDLFGDEQVRIATLAKKVEDAETLHDPNRVKVVTDHAGWALYFSRQAIPYVKGFPTAEWLGEHTFLKHLGVYAFRYDALKAIAALPVSSLEKAESLEQLRWLQNGFRIRVGITAYESAAVDRPEDVKKLQAPGH
ncbi:MAG: 3-deoxy-manno-octulosonate cytidylyltransferase [Flavobacteriales bacterium]|nr:3-deoxy-manno-octulosonate cytidylyltransferase [Flavobacteriales bacterium]MCB9449266.1 3-deoxy-manno-octulosonate cytidylyltransferase [Flavobacteriales bacterium]